MIIKIHQFGDGANLNTLIQAVHLCQTYWSTKTHRKIRIMHCSNIKDITINELAHIIIS